LTLLLCLVIFLAGVAVGYGVAVVLPPPAEPKRPASLEERRDRLAGRIDENVGLSDEQLAQTRAILEQRLAEVETIRKQIHPHLGRQARTLDVQMRAILRPEQLPAWEAFFEETFGRFTQAAADADASAGQSDDDTES
jgi:hypothetical protein